MADVVPSHCLWCGGYVVDTSQLHTFVMHSFKSKQSASKWVKQAKKDLLLCFDCVEVYYQQLDEAISCDARFQVDIVRELVYDANFNRTMEHFCAALAKFKGKSLPSKKDKHHHGSSGMEFGARELYGRIECSIREVLKHPRLLLTKDLMKVFAKIICQLLKANISIDVGEKFPGVYLFLVHPIDEIRRWAMNTVKTLGPLDWDDYDDLEEVISWIVTVISFDLFKEPRNDIEFPAWNEKATVVLPSFLFVHSSPKDFWLGLCMLITAMDTNCTRSRLFSSSGGHQVIVDATSNVITLSGSGCITSCSLGTESRAAVFWPVLQCFSLLLSRLQSRYWQLSTERPMRVLEQVLASPFFLSELNKWAARAEEQGSSRRVAVSEETNSESAEESDDEMITDSQFVYQCGGQRSRSLEKTNPNDSQEVISDQSDLMALQIASSSLKQCTFSWMVPFLQSLLDFGADLVMPIVELLLNALCSLIKLSALGLTAFDTHHLDGSTVFSPVKDDTLSILVISQRPLCDNTLFVLSCIIELLLLKHAYVFLVNLQSKWLPIFANALLILLKHSGMRGSCSRSSSQSRPLPLALSHMSKVAMKLFRGRVDALSVRMRTVLSLKSTIVEHCGDDTISNSPCGEIPTQSELCSLVLDTLSGCSCNDKQSTPFSSTSLEGSPADRYSEEDSHHLPSTSGDSDKYDDEAPCTMVESPGKTIVPLLEPAIHSDIVDTDETPDLFSPTTRSGFQNQDMNVQRPSVDVKQSHISTEESTDELETPLRQKKKKKAVISQRQQSVAGKGWSSESDVDDFDMPSRQPPSSQKARHSGAIASSSKKPKSHKALFRVKKETKASSETVVSPLPSMEVDKKAYSSSDANMEQSFKLTLDPDSSDSSDSSDCYSPHTKPHHLNVELTDSEDTPHNVVKQTPVAPLPEYGTCEESAATGTGHGVTVGDSKASTVQNMACTSADPIIISDSDSVNSGSLPDYHVNITGASAPQDIPQSHAIEPVPDSSSVSRVLEATPWCSREDLNSTVNSLQKVCGWLQSTTSEPPSHQGTEGTPTYHEEIHNLQPGSQTFIIHDLSKEVCSGDHLGDSDEEYGPALVAAATKGLRQFHASTKEDVEHLHERSRQYAGSVSGSEHSHGDELASQLDVVSQQMISSNVSRVMKVCDLPVPSNFNPSHFELVPVNPRLCTVRLERLDISKYINVSREHEGFVSTNKECETEAACTSDAHKYRGQFVHLSDSDFSSTESPALLSTISSHSDMHVEEVAMNVHDDQQMDNSSASNECGLVKDPSSLIATGTAHTKGDILLPQTERGLPLVQAELPGASTSLTRVASLSDVIQSDVVPKPCAHTKPMHDVGLRDVHSDKSHVSDIDAGPSVTETGSLDDNIVTVDTTQSHVENIAQTVASYLTSTTSSNVNATLPCVRTTDVTALQSSSASMPLNETEPLEQLEADHSQKLGSGNVLDSTANFQGASSLVVALEKPAKQDKLPDKSCTTHSVTEQSHSVGVIAQKSAPRSAVTKPPNSQAKHYVITQPSRPLLMESFYTEVLSWDPEPFVSPPRNENNKPLKQSYPSGSLTPIPECFENFDQYYKAFKPLLFMELWETVFQDMTATDGPKCLPCTVQIDSLFSSSVPQLQTLQCHCMVRSHSKTDSFPAENDLVIINFLDLCDFATHFIDSVTSKRSKRFACVESVQQSVATNQESSCKGRTKQTSTTVTFVLKVFGLNVSSSYLLEQKKISIVTATSLTTVLRQWSALINFHTSQLARDVLSPRGGVYFGKASCGQDTNEESTRSGHCLNGKSYNNSQFQAIEVAVRSACEGYALPRIILLQGPPGTGKTHTIVGMIHEMLQELQSKHKEEQGRPLLPGQHCRSLQPHILVCAPSNAGVDELARRLLKQGLVKNTPHLRKNSSENANPPASRGKEDRSTWSGFSVVRVGRKEKIHPDVHGISLDDLVKKKLCKDMTAVQNIPLDELKRDISKLEEDIDNLERQNTVLSMGKETSDSPGQIQAIDDQLKCKRERRTHLSVEYRVARTRKQNSRKEEARIRRKLLMDADIICATLSGAGAKHLMDCFQRNPLHFTCVIVDEASQCCELDTLVPLRYLSSKLIMIGDPKQLPATVKSRKAISYKYGRSLFERFYDQFHKLKNSDNPVRMLEEQYRMLPEICQFPSDYFYSSRLKTCNSLMGKEARLPFKPFVVFDIEDGQELDDKGSRSIYNTTECRLLIELCSLLLNSGKITPRAIGVITPYKAQESIIKRELYTRFSKVSTIDVGTVDSFQGREKDVIIMSCVRARSGTGTIGFLSSCRRMNVALTRARKALYLLGHLNSLMISKDWKALIDHAKKTRTIVCLKGIGYEEAARQVQADVPLVHSPIKRPHIATTHSPSKMEHSRLKHISKCPTPLKSPAKTNVITSPRRKLSCSMPQHPLSPRAIASDSPFTSVSGPSRLGNLIPVTNICHDSTRGRTAGTSIPARDVICDPRLRMTESGGASNETSRSMASSRDKSVTYTAPHCQANTPLRRPDTLGIQSKSATSVGTGPVSASREVAEAVNTGITGVRGTGLSKCKPSWTPTQEHAPDIDRIRTRKRSLDITDTNPPKRSRMSESEHGGSSSGAHVVPPTSCLEMGSLSMQNQLHLRTTSTNSDDSGIPSSHSSRSQARSTALECKYPSKNSKSQNLPQEVPPAPQEESTCLRCYSPISSASRSRSATPGERDDTAVDLSEAPPSSEASATYQNPMQSSDWRLHGGARQRVAHAREGTIQRSRNVYRKLTDPLVTHDCSKTKKRVGK